MSNRQPAGLFIRDTETRVPLTGVRISVEGRGSAARVTVSQRYRNTEKTPIEAVYSFPLEESSAVCAFRVETGGRVIVGKVEEKEKAFEIYDNALADGNGAFLVDQDRPNIFTASVGNLNPNQEALISISYASELEQHGDSVRVMIPTTIAPRYIPQEQLNTIDPAELDHIAPPTVIGAVPYGLAFDLSYEAPQGIKSINCPSHPAQVEIDGNTARVSLMGRNIQLDSDVVVNVTLARPHEAGVIVTRDGDGSRAVMLNFFPDLKQKRRGPSEFLFVVDRSGSMEGESIQQAKNALLLALRSMESGDRFNVIGFGSVCDTLFPEPVAYTQKSLEEAVKKLQTWRADMGGTDILEPLKLIFEKYKPSELPRQVMFLTDGEVSNEAECIALTQKHAVAARIFTFGIGHGASEHLVRGLARASGGQAEFIQPNERIEPKVMRQFARANSPRWQNVRVDWGELKTDLVAPDGVACLYDGDRVTLYGRVIGGVSSDVAILADGPEGRIRVPQHVDLERLVDAPAVPVLMARRAIQDIAEGRAEPRGSAQTARREKVTQNRVLELALRYQLMSSQTSFVAVEERSATDKTVARAELRRVPIALTKGYGALGDCEIGALNDVDCLRAEAPDAMLSLELAAPAEPLKRSKSMPRAAKAPASPAPASVARIKAKKAGYSSVPGSVQLSQNAPTERERGFIGGLLDRLAGKSSSGPNQGGSGDNFIVVAQDAIGEASEKAEAETVSDMLQYLIALQHFDGHFEIDERNTVCMHVPDESLSRLLGELSGRTLKLKEVASTLLALVLLETDFAARRDEWVMLADKAERWLEAQHIPTPPGAASLKAWALGLLKK